MHMGQSSLYVVTFFLIWSILISKDLRTRKLRWIIGAKIFLPVDSVWLLFPLTNFVGFAGVDSSLLICSSLLIPLSWLWWWWSWCCFFFTGCCCCSIKLFVVLFVFSMIHVDDAECWGWFPTSEEPSDTWNNKN